MKPLLSLAAAAEAITGFLAIFAPTLVTRLLWDQEVSGVGLALARVCGIALLSLGWACWPSGDARAAAAMLLYSLLSTAYLGYLGIGGESVGPLLWPAVSYHAVVAALLLAWAWRHQSWRVR